MDTTTIPAAMTKHIYHMFPEERRVLAEATKEERLAFAEATPHQWETCAICGKSEKDHFVNTGFDMLVWHVDIGMLCEDCYPEYPD